MARVFHKNFYLPGSFLLACSGMLFAQPQQPPVKVNVLNVCAPSAEEQKEISSALARVPRQPLFSDDFEVARGRSSLGEAPIVKFRSKLRMNFEVWGLRFLLSFCVFAPKLAPIHERY